MTMGPTGGWGLGPSGAMVTFGLGGLPDVALPLGIPHLAPIMASAESVRPGGSADIIRPRMSRRNPGRLRVVSRPRTAAPVSKILERGISDSVSATDQVGAEFVLDGPVKPPHGGGPF